MGHYTRVAASPDGHRTSGRRLGRRRLHRQKRLRPSQETSADALLRPGLRQQICRLLRSDGGRYGVQETGGATYAQVMTFFMALVQVLISIIFLLLLSRAPARSQNNFFSGKT